MLTARSIKALEGIIKATANGHKVRGLFKILTNHNDLWLQAYSEIYSNKGSLTKGVDNNTLDGFSEDRVESLIRLIKDNRYYPKPVRRTYIPKSNGKERPLGIPSGNDKLVQAVMKNILECVYEPVFSKYSHGFRKEHSCHTALTSIKHTWTGIKWLIEVDIKGYFDNISHTKLIHILEKKIDDKNFIRLIKHFLKAGYMEQWEYHKTFSGTPQGGIISPILANIYLNELDIFVEELCTNTNKGKEKRWNPAYNKLNYQNTKLRKEIDRLGAKSKNGMELRKTVEDNLKIMRTIPSKLTHDPSYRKLVYVRYADDFLLGFIGTKTEANDILKNIKTFLSNELELNISEEKSKVEHNMTGVRFLGHDVKGYSAEKLMKVKVGGRHCKTRTVTAKLDIYVPMEKVLNYMKVKKYGSLYPKIKTKHRAELMELSEVEIILTYNAELRGFENFYAMAYGVKGIMNRLDYIANGSLYKTLAAKHKTTLMKIKLMMKQEPGVYVWKDSKSGREAEVFSSRSLITKPSRYYKDIIPNFNIHKGGNELTKRVLARTCEYCGKTDGYHEVHHIRKMKDVSNNKAPWARLMISRNRKTLVLCIECHDQLHKGTLPSWKKVAL
jgi:RNA-directed DNA polymerase